MGIQLLLDEESHHTPHWHCVFLTRKREGADPSFLLNCLSVVRPEKQGEIPAEGDLSKKQVFCVGVCTVCVSSSIFPSETHYLIS